MSRATEIKTSRRGDVTNAREKQTVIQIIEPAVAVTAGALEFTVCYDLTKVHFNSADCLNT